MQTEPSVIVGGITAFVTALIGLLVAFGLDITDDQRTAILSMTAVVAPLAAGIIIRYKVFAPATVERIANEQYEAGLPPPQPQPDVPDPAAV